ncbi:uncharacterized protein LOC133559071 [Nerophis ophidion]|uniref:uncharacterized protein LOC133559071 n=1 Tax=Nerophis ophidion TaxID=159077 RepID=UPI002AE07047|nr:uncharacterized protein LOC133559071 [Nerophis ophidion]
MPQYSTDIVDRREEVHENICSASGPNVQSEGLLKEASVGNGHRSRTSIGSNRLKRSKPVQSNATKPPYMLNGLLNHGFKGKDTQAAPARTKRKHRSTFSTIIGPGRSSHSSAPSGILVNRTAREDHASSTSKQPANEPSPPASTRASSLRWRRKNSYKKRDSLHACPEKPTQHKTPPLEDEDWEKDCQANVENRVQPSGQEDVLQLTLQGLSLDQWEALGIGPNYSPAIHHSHPLQWHCPEIAAEPEQFADAVE